LYNFKDMRNPPIVSGSIVAPRGEVGNRLVGADVVLE
jgi:hypothetical protein